MFTLRYVSQEVLCVRILYYIVLQGEFFSFSGCKKGEKCSRKVNACARSRSVVLYVLWGHIILNSNDIRMFSLCAREWARKFGRKIFFPLHSSSILTIFIFLHQILFYKNNHNKMRITILFQYKTKVFWNFYVGINTTC